MSGWQYIRESLIGDETVGPISDQQLLLLAYEGTIEEDTKVSHPKHTKGEWVHLYRIPVAKKRIEEGITDREKQAQAEKEERKERKTKAKEEAAHHKAQAIQEAAEKKASSPTAAFLLDGQPESTVTKIYDRMQELLTTGESIQYIAVQARPVRVAADCAVLTNRRLLICRPKILGRLSFEDFLWRELQDAHLDEGVMFGTLTVKSVNGAHIKLGYLPKNQARRVYRICQEKEEEAIEERRRRKMEESKAGAANVVVNAPTEGMGQRVAPEAAAGDPVEKLAKLKKMLDAGLIEQSEYEQNKMRILESM